jgi:hypothetical protein
MGDFYGYDPSRFVVPDRYGIGAASQAASKTVMNVSQAVSQKKEAEAKEKERQEKIRLAAEAIAKDKNGMRLVYDSVLKNYTRTVNSLVKEGVLTQEEADQKLGTLYSLEPADIALKDPMKYLTALNEANISFMNDLGKVKKEFEGQRNQGRVTGAVTQAMRGSPAIPGSPATPDQTVVNPETISAGVGRGALRAPMNAWGDAETTTIPGTPAIEPQAAIPPARNQQEAYLGAQEALNKQGAPPATKSQFVAGGIDYQQDLDEIDIKKEKNDIQQKRLDLAKNKETNINWYREQMVNLANAKDDLARTNIRKDLDKFDVALISVINDTEDEIKKLKNQTDALGQPVEIDPIELAKKQLTLEEYKTIKNQTINDLKLQTIRRGITTKPRGGYGETPSSIPTRERPSGNLPSLTTETDMGQTTLPGPTKKKQKIGQFIVEEE